jgi:transposase
VDTFRKEYTVFMDREKKPTKRERRPRRTFTAEFREGAVALVLDEGKSISQVARDLDLTHSGLSEWVKQARADRGIGKPGALTTSEKEELARLRKENRELRMEREILKKAAAFFAKESK